MKYLLSIGLLFTILLLQMTKLSGQIDYQKGYVVFNTGDTLNGFIKEFSDKDGLTLLFKKNSEQPPDKLTASQLTGFRYHSGALYESNTVWNGTDSVDVFLTCLILGSIDLYSFVDNTLKKRFYIKTPTYGLRELRDVTETITEENGNKKIKRNRYFRGELKNAMRACPAIYSQVDNTHLTYKSLLKIFSTYYSCVSEKYGRYYKYTEQQKGEFEWTILGGFNRLKLKRSRLSTRSSITDIPDRRYGYNFGIYVDYYLPKTTNQFAIGVGYRKFFFKLKNRTLSLDEISFNLSRYYMVNERYRVFLGAGIDRIISEEIKAMEICVRGGQDFKIKKLRIMNSAEIRFGITNIVAFNIGIRI